MLIGLFLWLATIFAPKFEKVLSFLNYLRPHALLLQRLGKAALLIAGTVFIIFYLKVINPMYLSQGRVSALKRKTSNS